MGIGGFFYAYISKKNHQQIVSGISNNGLVALAIFALAVLTAITIGALAIRVLATFFSCRFHDR